jgi:hypothetical protein
VVLTADGHKSLITNALSEQTRPVRFDTSIILKPPILIGGPCKPTNAMYHLFKNITFKMYRCDVFEKMIDVGRSNLLLTD